MPLIVSLDIETTGLDPNNESIIEIGMVKFSESRVVAEYSKLVNPRKPISNFITNLTGITNSMVMHMPYLVDLLPEVQDFVGDAIVLGQNIGFDLSFFYKVRALQDNLSIDTYDLASVLMPSAPRYNLGALSKYLGVVQTTAHRALDDARATMDVYNRFKLKLMSCPSTWLLKSCAKPKGWIGKVNFPSAGLYKK